MKQYLLCIFIVFIWADSFASQDSVVVPLSRQLFHDRIDNEQLLIDMEDGKKDGMIRVSANESVNIQVTDALIRRINEFQYLLETNDSIVSSNEKIRQLNFIEIFLRYFRVEWEQNKIDPSLAPLLVDNFYKAWVANKDGNSILPFIAAIPYETGSILTEVFPKNIGYTASKNLLFIKRLINQLVKIIITYLQTLLV